MIELTDEYNSKLSKKYNILGHISLLSVDKNFKLLENYLRPKIKEQFNINDRFIIEHLDTDFYISEFKYGLNLYNLFSVFKNLNIPLFTLLLFTNHFGIDKEVKELAPDLNDFPTLIYSFISKLHYTNKYQDIKFTNNIELPAICMMGYPRVHRLATYHFLKDNNLFNLVATSI